MIKEFFGKVVEAVVEHQPVIAGVVLVGSIIATGIVIYKESPKIHKAMEERKEDLKDVESNDDLSKEEKAQTVKEVNQETLKKVAPSVLAIVGASCLTAGAVVFYGNTFAAVAAPALAGAEFASQKVEAFREVVKQEVPDKADDIEAKVDKKVAEAFAKYRGCKVDENATQESFTGKQHLIDEFGVEWDGSFVKAVAAMNQVNAIILEEGENVPLSYFYSKAGAKGSMFGRKAYFPYYKKDGFLKPTSIIDDDTGVQVAILITYEGNHPIIDDPAYLKSAAQKARERAGLAGAEN